MSGLRIDQLILYNEMQIKILENLNEYMGIVLTPEMRVSLIQLLNNLRREILNTSKILYSIIKRETTGRHVNVFLPNILNTLVVGERGTGKSTYINRLKTGNFNPRYFITEKPEPHMLYIDHSNAEQSLGCYFNFRLLTEIERDPSAELFKYANVAFVFYSVDSLSTYKAIPEWIDKILSVVPDCKIFICASMIDKPRNSYIPKPKQIYTHRNVDYPQISFSTKTLENYTIPTNMTLMHFRSNGLIH